MPRLSIIVEVATESVGRILHVKRERDSRPPSSIRFTPMHG